MNAVVQDIEFHRDEAVAVITRLALTLAGFARPPACSDPSPPPLFLFGTLPNGAAIRGTGRLRKLRPSAVTRRF
jgi:hypothetical protein